MMRLFITLVACVAPAGVHAFPGSLLRGFRPQIEKIRKLPVRLPEAPVQLPQGATDSTLRLSLPDVVRNALMCCKDVTAECMACATNQDLTQFCSKHVRVPGCESVVQKSQEKALDGILNNAVEKMAEKVGGVRAEELVDRYLEKNPGVARKNLANLTNEAFDTVSSLKKSMLRNNEDAAPTVEKSPIWHKGGKSGRVFTQADDFAGPENLANGDEGERLGQEEDEDDDDDEEPDSEGFSLRNPWVIAAAALLVTAVSTGVAMGALCHARMQSTHAREPLLSTMLQEAEAGTSAGGNAAA